jgi:RimJ/RimL family protein N-acetyltransferase
VTVPDTPIQEGPLVRLRRPERADLLEVFDWYNDPQIVSPFDRFELDTFEEFSAAVEAAPGEPRSLAPRWVVERSADHRRLGLVGHYRPHPVLETVDVWYVIGDPGDRGKGYGREAVRLLVDWLFREEDLERVGATCDVANLPSSRLLERLGFRLEGTMRSSLFHHGGWHDVRVYGVTRSEWYVPSESRNTTRSNPPG